MRKIPTWEWLGLGVVGVAAAVVGFQLGKSQFDYGTALSGIALTVVLALAVGAATWKLQPAESGTPHRRLTWHGVARFTLAAIAALSAGYFADSAIDPNGTQEREPFAIEDGVDEANDGIRDVRETVGEIADNVLPRSWRALENIEGYWCEEHEDSPVVFHIQRTSDGDQQGLIVTLVRSQPGVRDHYRMTASVTGGEGDVLTARLVDSTEPDEDGDALTFTYAYDGVNERLDWLNERRSEAGALRLEKCDASQ